MPRSLPPLTWFRAFEASARHLSFTAAAQELHLTQSAISQQVKSLETRFKVTLFQRLPRGLALTDEGRRLLPEVSSALATLVDVASGYERIDSDEQITVAASVSFIQWIIAPGMQRLLALNPALKLRLISTVWPDDFNAADADIEIRFGSESLVGDGARRLLPDELIVVASPKISASKTHLEEQALIETVGASDGWAEWARSANYSEKLLPTIYVDYYGAALDLAIAGAGIALTSSLLAAHSLATGALEQIRSEALHSSDGYFLAIRVQDTEAVKIFTNWLEEESHLISAKCDQL